MILQGGQIVRIVRFSWRTQIFVRIFPTLYGNCTWKKSDTSQNSYNFPKIVFFFKSGFEKEDGVKYRGNRDMKSLEKYIQEQLGNEAPEEPAKVRSISALVDEQP